MDPSSVNIPTRCDHSSRLHKNRATNLVDLPEEVLEEIASHLNSDSRIAFASTSHRLQRTVRSSLESTRLRRIPEYVLDHLKINGSSIRRLDLSNCKASWVDIKSAIRLCPHVTELNVINSEFRSLETLPVLKKLETLCMSALKLVESGLSKFREPLNSIKRLYLDVGPQEEALIFTIVLMNLCEPIEFVHVNLYGSQSSFSADAFPVLAPARWKTLSTFVCTRHLSDGEFHDKLLRSVFTYNSVPGVYEWISELRDCYIYENGHLNRHFSDHIILNENVKLLREYHDGEMIDGNTDNVFRSAYGFPRSIRLKSFDVFTTAVGCSPSTVLKELDLTRCHIAFNQNFRLSLIAATPSLETLACSLCFFVPTESRHKKEDVSSQQKAFGDALRKLKLKTFSVKGVSHIGNCSSSCICGHEGWPRCSACTVATPLTSSNMVDFSGFPHLEDLMLSGVTMRDSAYEKIACPKLRCVRLCMNAHNEYSGLQGFIQRCRNLRYLKVEGFELPVRSENFWKVLDRGMNLTQLCLRSGIYGLDTPELSEELLDCFERIVQRVEIVHLHCSDRELRLALQKSRKGAYKRLETTNHYDFHLFSSRDVRNSTADSSLTGRALCLSDCSTGLVPPLGWDIE